MSSLRTHQGLRNLDNIGPRPKKPRPQISFCSHEETDMKKVEKDSKLFAVTYCINENCNEIIWSEEEKEE